MANTIRSTSYLLNSEFQDGQAAGSITPQDMRDLIVSLSIFQSVLQYGADPTGATDSTAAFHNAMVAGIAVVPPGTYALNNCIVPQGGQLWGFASISYGDSYTNTSVKPRIIPATTTTPRIFNVDGCYEFLLSGLYIDCGIVPANACDGISAGGKTFTLRDIYVAHANNGIGGAVPGGTGATNSSVCTFFSCEFIDCNVGINEVTDFFTYGGAVSYSGIGFKGTGAATGSCDFNGFRFEWCTSYGLYVTNASDIRVTGGCFDRNYVAGAYLSGTFKSTFTGVEFKRNGRNLDTSSCHVLLNSASNISFTGCTSNHGKDDDGTGNDAPLVCVREQGTSDHISFVGSNVTGVASGGSFWSGNLPTNYTSWPNDGIPLGRNDVARPRILGGFIYQDGGHGINLGTSTSNTFAFTHLALTTFSNAYHEIRVFARDQSTGAAHGATFKMVIARESGTPTISNSSAYGEIGTAGYIAFGSGTISLSWTSIAADGSAFTLTFTNTSASVAFTVGCELS